LLHRRGRQESSCSSLQWLYQIKESADPATQSHVILERCLFGALPNSVQARTKPKTPHHLVNLLSQPRHYGAEAHHLISAVQVDAPIGFYQASQTMDAQCAIPANPSRHEHVLTLLASAQRSPSEKRLQLIGILAMRTGYLLSQVIRRRTARPFGFERLPSPIATPITQACSSESGWTGRAGLLTGSIEVVPEVGVEPTRF
jgi:hypothetical protein